MRAEAATITDALTVAPTARASTMRHQRELCRGRSVKYFGRVRSTSRKTSRLTVSMSTWVSARSGAPCNRKSRAVP